MHKLDKSVVAAPPCLASWNYLTQTWEDFGKSACKSQLRASLVQMQGIPGVTTQDANEYGLRCAYCEGAIYHAGHIEHFRRKNREHYPELMFDWNNLFLACGSHDHCGHYKDKNKVGGYNPDDLIKPDVHDPEHYLYFHSDGAVRVRDSLSDQVEINRASETIRVFGLDNPALAGERKSAVKAYKEKINFDELQTWSEQDRQEYLSGEIEATKWDAYATTIKHFLQATH